MKHPASMTGEELDAAIALHESAVRYYDAAESPQWSIETAERNANQRRLDELRRELGRRMEALT